MCVRRRPCSPLIKSPPVNSRREWHESLSSYPGTLHTVGGLGVHYHTSLAIKPWKATPKPQRNVQAISRPPPDICSRKAGTADALKCCNTVSLLPFLYSYPIVTFNRVFSLDNVSLYFPVTFERWNNTDKRESNRWPAAVTETEGPKGRMWGHDESGGVKRNGGKEVKIKRTNRMKN